jgi:hypothetical protein
MILHITDVTPLPGHRLDRRFTNGASGIVDLSDELDGEMFKPLKESNGADLAPEFLLQLLHRQRERAA